mmetsp:Transcript_95374/g.246985  ORF Transcript_95374/g.246985 Transcript_95374/m.246985 type:complete len:224 (+) Transcript_95374:548-1219(+)
MAQEGSPSTVRSSKMKTSALSTQVRVSCLWPTLDPTLMVRSSSCAPQRRPTSMASTSSLAKSLRAWTLSRKSRRLALLVVQLQKRSRSPSAASWVWGSGRRLEPNEAAIAWATGRKSDHRFQLDLGRFDRVLRTPITVTFLRVSPRVSCCALEIPSSRCPCTVVRGTPLQSKDVRRGAKLTSSFASPREGLPRGSVFDGIGLPRCALFPRRSRRWNACARDCT